ncbi:hypothetical protein [Cupriavidus sp. TMH.W2]|uniref:hypothetical protein n=1 Tax=Cupriavidus sp. TMH.W2 TaxID=3434465 RepID=UPI003D772604
MHQKVIDFQLGKSGQNLLCKKLIEISGVRLLVDIKVDSSVEAQSWAKISRWDGQQWQLVYSLNYTDMPVDFKVAYRAGPPQELAVAPLVDRLVKVARQIAVPGAGLADYLNQVLVVHGLTDEEKRHLDSPDPTPSRARLTLNNGQSLLVEGPFEMVGDRLKVWTPMDKETFALLQPGLIAKISFSE